MPIQPSLFLKLPRDPQRVLAARVRSIVAVEKLQCSDKASAPALRRLAALKAELTMRYALGRGVRLQGFPAGGDGR